MTDKRLAHLPLGRTVGFSPSYDPSQLCAVPRSLGRTQLPTVLGPSLPFFGEDIWNCWEVSWLDASGKPEIALVELRVPAESPFLVESKSLKLYLNSFNMTRVSSEEAFRATVKEDVSRVVGTEIDLHVWRAGDFSRMRPENPEGFCIDSLPFDPDMGHQPLLLEGGARVSEKLFSRLLRTNCPVTGQPDWATLHVAYTGKAICPASLLRHVVSLREHTGFHEACVESLFCALLTACQPERLTVYARFTRRGGIDINPFRSTEPGKCLNQRDFRQ